MFKAVIQKLILTIILILCTTSISAYAFTSYRDSAGEVVRLSEESSRPFLFQGKPVLGRGHEDKSAERREKKYASSLKQFPSVRECLLKSERDAKQPDLTKFDWDAIDNTDDAEVCIFRVADSYNTPEDMRKWFKTQGGEVWHHDPYPDERVGVAVSWSINKEHGTKISANFLQEIWINMIAKGLGVGMEYDEKGKVVNVGVTFTIL